MNIHDYKRGLASITRGRKEVFWGKKEVEKEVLFWGNLDSARMEMTKEELEEGYKSRREYLKMTERIKNRKEAALGINGLWARGLGNPWVS